MKQIGKIIIEQNTVKQLFPACEDDLQVLQICKLTKLWNQCTR